MTERHVDRLHLLASNETNVRLRKLLVSAPCLLQPLWLLTSSSSPALYCAFEQAIKKKKAVATVRDGDPADLVSRECTDKRSSTMITREKGPKTKKKGGTECHRKGPGGRAGFAVQAVFVFFTPFSVCLEGWMDCCCVLQLKQGPVRLATTASLPLASQPFTVTTETLVITSNP